MSRTFPLRVLVPGAAEGAACVSAEPLSFWGGFDPATGRVIDRRHDCCGRVVTGKVFLLPGGKGSSTASACLLEAIRAGTAPAAIVTLRPAPILALGAIVADELYGRSVPVVVAGREVFDAVRDGDRVAVATDGTLTVRPGEAD